MGQVKPKQAKINQGTAVRPDPFEGRYPPRPPAGPPEVVDPVWILKALGLCVLAAAILAYAAICLLIYQGSWQLLLHPAAQGSRTPSSVGLGFTRVRFDAGESGQPRLSGWWIAGSEPLTILYLHGGSGSLADTVNSLARLHASGANVFAFDYRGFGQSDPQHPNEERMTEDARAALAYLLDTRHISSVAVVPYGAGLGCSLAAALAAEHPELPAVILDTPDPLAVQAALSSRRSRLLPMHWLVRDRFDPAPGLAGLNRPKLLLTSDPDAAANQANALLFRAAASPKLTVSLPYGAGDRAFLESLTRFFDEYLPPADLTRFPAPDVPSAAPASRKNAPQPDPTR